MKVIVKSCTDALLVLSPVHGGKQVNLLKGAKLVFEKEDFKQYENCCEVYKKCDLLTVTLGEVLEEKKAPVAPPVKETPVAPVKEEAPTVLEEAKSEEVVAESEAELEAELPLEEVKELAKPVVKVAPKVEVAQIRRRG